MQIHLVMERELSRHAVWYPIEAFLDKERALKKAAELNVKRGKEDEYFVDDPIEIFDWEESLKSLVDCPR